jgi:heme/copper-type cytochrome/quinol oxidase subunit 4
MGDWAMDLLAGVQALLMAVSDNEALSYTVGWALSIGALVLIVIMIIAQGLPTAHPTPPANGQAGVGAGALRRSKHFFISLGVRFARFVRWFIHILKKGFIYLFDTNDTFEFGGNIDPVLGRTPLPEKKLLSAEYPLFFATFLATIFIVATYWLAMRNVEINEDMVKATFDMAKSTAELVVQYDENHASNMSEFSEFLQNSFRSDSKATAISGGTHKQFTSSEAVQMLRTYTTHTKDLNKHYVKMQGHYEVMSQSFKVLSDSHAQSLAVNRTLATSIDQLTTATRQAAQTAADLKRLRDELRAQGIRINP